MKKITRVLVMALAASFILVACHKDRPEPVTQVINVSLVANQAYSNTLTAAGDRDDQLQITQQAMHYSLSTVSAKDANGLATFQYTPSKDYVGTDEVQIATAENHNVNGNGQSHGNCGGHHDGGVTYIYKITIGSGLTGK